MLAEVDVLWGKYVYMIGGFLDWLTTDVTARLSALFEILLDSTQLL